MAVEIYIKDKNNLAYLMTRQRGSLVIAPSMTGEIFFQAPREMYLRQLHLGPGLVAYKVKVYTNLKTTITDADVWGLLEETTKTALQEEIYKYEKPEVSQAHSFGLRFIITNNEAVDKTFYYTTITMDETPLPI